MSTTISTPSLQIIRTLLTTITVMDKVQKPAVPQAHTAWSLTFGKAMEIRRAPRLGIRGSTEMEAATWVVAVHSPMLEAKCTFVSTLTSMGIGTFSSMATRMVHSRHIHLQRLRAAFGTQWKEWASLSFPLSGLDGCLELEQSKATWTTPGSVSAISVSMGKC